MASYFMNAKKHVSLMFHKGAFIKDKSGLLEGEGKEGRVVKFSTLAEIEQRKGDLESVVKEWIKCRISFSVSFFLDLLPDGRDERKGTC